MNGMERKKVIGIAIEADGYSDMEFRPSHLMIGSVICPQSPCSASQLRLVLERHPSVPTQFRFITPSGWPIDKNNEECVEILQLINSMGIVKIQRHFDLPRLGISWADGKHLGFLFVSFKSYLTEVRNNILSVLCDKLDQASDFEFLDRHKWPVARAQESVLILYDVCNVNHVVINKIPSKVKPEPIPETHQCKILKQTTLLTKKRPLKVCDEGDLKKKARFKDSNNPNSILISYVHGEATTHARNLKIELVNMGLDSVFLDVDDIPAGQDWQDVINTALNNCKAFVPLVTPRYGETRWTNREAKLADDKDKLIIPISFLDKWPPDPLAIQFLSLQYIPWKTLEETLNEKEDEASSTNDISSWDPRCVHRVAKEIKKLCDVSTPDSLSIIDSNHTAGSSSMPFPPPANPPTKKDYIVISAHSNQKHLVDKITKMLNAEQFDVWPSFDMCDIGGDVVDSSCDDSQISDSSPILDSYFHHKAFNDRNISSCPNDGSYENKIEWKGAEKDYFQRKIKLFKRKIKEACLVIIVMSEDYIKSRTCLQLAFYCEYRREVIVIKYGDFTINSCILNFYPEQDMLKLTSLGEDISFLATLKKEIIKTVHEDKTGKSYSDHLQKMVAKLSSVLKIDNCVYVIGGTSTVSKDAEMFCIALGAELAKIINLTLVTEGFFGAGDLVGKNFCEEREIRAKGISNIYHVIPRKDNNITRRARQTEDGKFQKIPYGQTLFYGDSIAERDDIVTAAFKICILIEGGQRSACLAEKFLFNDCIVIPIVIRNNAISSQHCLKESLSKVPCGVNHNDWTSLVNFSAPADALAKTAKKIVQSLLKMRKICSIQNKIS